MPNRPRKQKAAVWTFATGAITALAGIATTSASKPLGVVLIVVSAIVLIFGAMLWYQTKTDRHAARPKPMRLDPAKLAAALDDKQREIFDIALPGVASEVANVVGAPVELVRANLFAKLPGSNRLGMVKDLWFQMNYEPEWTIQMEVGKGSAGLAFSGRNINRAIWKDGWGPSDLGDDTELTKVNPELRWILSTPIFGSADPAPKLVLSVDGLRHTPTENQLAEAIGHLPRFASVIARALYL